MMTFTLIKKQSIPAIKIDIEYYRHEETGAEHLHLKADHPENVFLVALRTVPTDSTGVAHILEHLSLCGSERYPVRDPFFMMTRRSLNTFMNAFTSSDWTAYPFASENKKDFNNLLDVYLDAVFFPRLHPLDFAQEGHRVEFEKPGDPQTELVFKGVVFNEMKGDMSSPISFLGDLINKHLYQQTTYHFNSGGDPSEIPNLTHEQLLAFHKKHYHPSNSIFMTFGDIPASEHQAQFESRVLSRFSKSKDQIHVPLEPRFSTPKKIIEKYPVTKLEPRQAYVAFAWLMGESQDYRETLAAQLLASLLLDNSASPLMHALETTPYASAPLSGGMGLQTENKQVSFVCGVEGADEQHADDIERSVHAVFENVAQHGFPADKIEAALHQLELSEREITGGQYPYGLQLILDCLSALIHRGDPFAALDLDRSLTQLRKDCEDPNFLKDRVKKWLLDNPHAIRLVALPDTEWTAQRQQQEKDRLAMMKKTLTASDQERIVQLAQQLKERQECEDDLSILPKMELSDIPPELHLPKPTLQNQNLTTFSAGTNGLVYQDVVLPLPTLNASLMAVLPYFTGFLTEIGCAGDDYLKTQSRQAAVSGGVYASNIVKADNHEKIRSYFTVSGKALARNHPVFSELIRDTLLSARFDELERIKELSAQARADAEKSIIYSGHQLAMTAAASRCNPLAYYMHRQGGLLGIQNTCALDDSLQDPAALKKLSEQFQEIHSLLLEKPRQFLLVGEADNLAACQRDVELLWGGQVSSQKASLLVMESPPKNWHQVWTIESEVNFCAKAYSAVGFYHPDTAALHVLAAFLKQGFLHRVIREQGGAYGGGATFNPVTLSFRFYSYRDPRLEETLDDFDRSIDWLLSNTHSQEKLEEAIFDVMGGLDKPSSPAGEARNVFYNALHGRTTEDLQALRMAVVHTTLDDLKRVAQKYLTGTASTAVITNVESADRYAPAGVERIDL